MIVMILQSLASSLTLVKIKTQEMKSNFPLMANKMEFYFLIYGCLKAILSRFCAFLKILCPWGSRQ